MLSDRSTPVYYTYDPMGNTLINGDLTFTYNQQGRMATATKTGMSASYLYNHKGERVSKSVNGNKSQYIFNMKGELIAEVNKEGLISSEYVYQNSKPLAKMTYYNVENSSIVTEGSSNHKWKTRQFPASVDSPVVLVGVPTHNGSNRGSAAIRNVTNDSVDVRFAEWDYLNGKHVQESMSVIALPQGRYTKADGSVWEVGTVEVTDDRKFTTVNFSNDFAGQPTLILTPQTSNDTSAFSVRSKELTNSSFKVAIFEEELNKNTTHATETIGYVAIYSSASTGVASFNGQNFNYQLASDSLKHKWKSIAGYELRIEEEKSADNEVRHVFETVNTFLIDGHLFAQDISTNGGNTTSLRRRTDTPVTTPTPSNNIYYYNNNHLGAPISLQDSEGTIQWAASHTPFGKAIVEVDNVTQNIRFPGQYFDQETGLHYNYFRDYDPSIGRYLQSDPIGLGGGLNTYSYASSNPINRYDLFGLKDCENKDDKEKEDCINKCLQSNYGSAYSFAQYASPFSALGAAGIASGVIGDDVGRNLTAEGNRNLNGRSALNPTRDYRDYSRGARQIRTVSQFGRINVASLLLGVGASTFIATANLICSSRCSN